MLSTVCYDLGHFVFAEQYGVHSRGRSHHRVQQGLQAVHHNETPEPALLTRSVRQGQSQCTRRVYQGPPNCVVIVNGIYTSV